MINKINRIYSIFRSDVVFSENSRINAITGYNVVFKANVLTKDDVCNWFYKNGKSMDSIPDSDIWLFTNPANDHKWYIGHNIIAEQTKEDIYNNGRPKILAICSGNRVLVENISTVLTYTRILGNITNVITCYDMGYLSTPHSVYLNCNSSTNDIASTVKLPFVV